MSDVAKAYEALCARTNHYDQDLFQITDPGRLHAHSEWERERVCLDLGLIERVQGPTRFPEAHGLYRITPLGAEVQAYARAVRALEGRA
jgi:hypothetical protein